MRTALLPLALALMLISPLACARTAADALADTAGTWRGELRYRDYGTNHWEALPMTVTVIAQPDGVTTLRTAQFDDGPKSGIVTITTATLIDPVGASADYASLRKGQRLDSGRARITAFTPGADDRHWTLVTQERRIDGKAIAQLRETTVRDGDTLTTTKDAAPVARGTPRWQPRYRTVLHRVAG